MLLCYHCFLILDNVASTVNATVDTTKNVAASAFDMGTTMIGSAKGSLFSFNSASCQHFALVICPNTARVHAIDKLYTNYVVLCVNNLKSNVDNAKSIVFTSVLIYHTTFGS